MKIIIKEDRVQNLVNDILNDEFGELYEYKRYTTDSTGEWFTIEFSKEGLTVMMYREFKPTEVSPVHLYLLYVSSEMLNKLSIFDFEKGTLERVVGEWFESVYELPVDRVSVVLSKQMN
jgi:hypothetical protein